MKNIKDSIFWIKNRLLRPKSYYAYMKSLEYDRLSGMEKSNREFSKMKELVEILFDEACILEGEPVANPGEFAKRLNALLKLM